MGALEKKNKWKDKLKDEFIEYWINAAYLAIFFSVFVLYRRLILSHYDILVDDYFMGVVKALIFAKVIMLGAFLRIDKRFDNKPLIIPVIYKALLFTILIIVFDIVEYFISKMISLRSLTLAKEELVNHFSAIWLGGVMVVFVSFLPFFAMKELTRIIGYAKVKKMFFSSRK